MQRHVPAARSTLKCDGLKLWPAPPVCAGAPSTLVTCGKVSGAEQCSIMRMNLDGTGQEVYAYSEAWRTRATWSMVLLRLPVAAAGLQCWQSAGTGIDRQINGAAKPASHCAQ